MNLGGVEIGGFGEGRRRDRDDIDTVPTCEIPAPNELLKLFSCFHFIVQV